MFTDCSAAILCGGQSRRMGQDKAGLLWKGETFLEHLQSVLAPIGTLYISQGADRSVEGLQGIPVTDRYEHCGPLGGLHALLTECRTNRLFVTTVDLPLTDWVIAEEILSYLTKPIDAVVPVAADGRLHPLCAAYRTSILPVVAEQLESGNYRIRDLLDRIRVCYVPVEKLTDGAAKLDNINTPQDYQRFLRETASRSVKSFAQDEREAYYLSGETDFCHLPVISVVAYSGSGKTTFLEKLIVELKCRGVRLAVIKHDAHDFEVDYPGKDSYRFTHAGADTVILTSERKAVRMDQYPVSVDEWIRRLQKVDLVLTEGYKHGPYQKILLYQEAAGKPVSIDLKKEQPLCIVSDRREWPDAVCPVFTLEDAKAVAGILESMVKCGKQKRSPAGSDTELCSG
ncbi:MAG: molybdopterin-guanine dinucleotide biosynthesis protein B [Clostridiales bacterium]|nr:molybdopterin-guanine dinucleotide biosynthesis protein B [Clostridiales bacterium]